MHRKNDDDLIAVEKMGRKAKSMVDDLALAVKEGWLRARFLMGRWRGVMIHADHGGKLRREASVYGLNIEEGDPRFYTELGGKAILTINDEV